VVPVIDGSTIAVVVPAFNEERLIRTTVATIPEFVDRVFVIDDASTDGTAQVVGSEEDPRITLIRHEINTGVGGAIISGHRAALAAGIDISAVMAGDAQIPPEYLESLVRPLIANDADFTKGNRFFRADQPILAEPMEWGLFGV
jgi:glycosyltransferase involved in cell wall biosynthesis